MKIAIDAMGGDHAPKEPIKGAIESLDLIKGNLVLIGNKEKIELELKNYTYDDNRITIIHTTEVVENEDKPVKAIKSKKDSSMVVGMKMLRHGEIDAFVSAGNTGALLAGGLLKVGRIKGIDRPAICSVYPTTKGASVIVDAGANAECKPRNLHEFAHMASIYAEKVFEIDSPKVGLVNIGSEEGKGNSLVQESYDLLKESKLNFIGNLEARNIPLGDADVIVCDGFTGNVILKLSEGVAKSFTMMLKESFLTNFKTKLAALVMKKPLSKMKKVLDYTEYGGAPLLGCEGLIIKAHGSSNSKAFKNAIKYAEKCVVSDVVNEIKKSLEL